MTQLKFSEVFTDALIDLDYTHCFFVAGGNIMHLIESLSHRMIMIPVINEVATVIAAEYFNEVSRGTGEKALALVTAGPGITNAITGIAGAFTESREVLIVGGQVKKNDLSRGKVRQRGIQEIDGISLVDSICIRTLRIETPIPKQEIVDFISQPTSSRKGPIFIEMCLDAQNTLVNQENCTLKKFEKLLPPAELVRKTIEVLRKSKRPVLLIGSGVDLQYFPELVEISARLGLPVLTSWNAADRISSNASNYFGRPNNWGQRHSNLIMQQADVLIAAGTRLGFQQTGFNFEEFAPLAQIIQIDLDEAEIVKGHPRVDIGIVADAAETLRQILRAEPIDGASIGEWLELCQLITELVPVPDPENTGSEGYVEVFRFVHELSTHFGANDVVVPCSSGGGSTVTMQVIQQKGLPQRIVTNKGMASMGYGLPGAIGACFARPDNTTWLIDGDGGFTQNTQELGVVGQYKLPLKIFIISNNGYASIRSTQRNYFGGHYVGCDPGTGLHLPEWKTLADAYGIKYFAINPLEPFSPEMVSELVNREPTIFEIPVDPEQTFFPKIQSRISLTKGMESNPLHEMTPILDRELMNHVAPFLTHLANSE
jgi:acetolactate synthase-1/2/3 large subunit